MAEWHEILPEIRETPAVALEYVGWENDHTTHTSDAGRSRLTEIWGGSRWQNSTSGGGDEAHVEGWRRMAGSVKCREAEARRRLQMLERVQII